MTLRGLGLVMILIGLVMMTGGMSYLGVFGFSVAITGIVLMVAGGGHDDNL